MTPSAAENAPPRDNEANIQNNLQRAGRARWRRLLKPDDSEHALHMIALSTALIAIVVVGVAMQAARWLLIPIVTAFLLSILLAPISDALRRLRLPEGARAGIVVLATVFSVLALIYTMTRPTISFSQRLPEIASEARDKLTGVEDAVSAVKEVSDEVDEVTDIEDGRDEPQEVVIANPSVPTTIAASTRLVLVQGLFISVLTFFFLASRSSFKRKVMMAPASFTDRLRIARTMRDIERNVGAYMVTMLLINIGLGVATALALWALGAPSPLLWGALAGVLNFLPYIGPITITVLLALMGIVNFDTGLAMAAPALAYMALNFVESNFVTPALVGVRLRLTPVAIILSISFWTWIWGPIGAVLSIPILVIIKAICDRSDNLRALGVLIGELKPIRRREVSGLGVRTFASRSAKAKALVRSGKR